MLGNDMTKWKLMAPDDGSGSGGGNAGDPAGNSGEGGGDPANDKTFTQDQVNSMLANEKRKHLASVYKGLGFESEDQAKEFVEKYRGQEEKNKTDLEKEQARTKQLEAEKRAEQMKAQDLQYKFDAMAEGCDAKAAGDVVVLAKAKMSDDKDFATALKEVKEQYPAMFNQTDSKGGTGSGGTSPRRKIGSGDLSGMGKRLAEARKQNNTAKNNDYFK